MLVVARGENLQIADYFSRASRLSRFSRDLLYLLVAALRAERIMLLRMEEKLFFEGR